MADVYIYVKKLITGYGIIGAEISANMQALKSEAEISGNVLAKNLWIKSGEPCANMLAQQKTWDEVKGHLVLGGG